MKKLTIGAMIMLGLSTNLFSNENIMTGDARTACEVLLCLSSEERPKECEPPLNHFYSIKDKKAWKTLKKRRDFLSLCPTDTGDTSEEVIMGELKDTIASGNPDECKPEFLNKQFDYINKNERIIYYKNGILQSANNAQRYTRIKPHMPQFCYNLINHQYTDYRTPKNNCNSDYYTVADWSRGYKFETITREQYNSLPANEKYMNSYSKSYECGGESSRTCTDHYAYYYKKTKINKTCWSY